MNSIGWFWLVADRQPDRIRSNRHLDRQSDRDRSSAPIANLIAIAQPSSSGPNDRRISSTVTIKRIANFVPPRTITLLLRRVVLAVWLRSALPIFPDPNRAIFQPCGSRGR